MATKIELRDALIDVREIARDCYNNWREYWDNHSVEELEDYGILRYIEDRLMVLSDLKTDKGERIYDESMDIYGKLDNEPQPPVARV